MNRTVFKSKRNENNNNNNKQNGIFCIAEVKKRERSEYDIETTKELEWL